MIESFLPIFEQREDGPCLGIAVPIPGPGEGALPL